MNTTREFNFPPSDIVDEYLEDLIATGRLERLNHTALWKSSTVDDDDEDESIGDDLLTPSSDVRKLYADSRIDNSHTHRHRSHHRQKDHEDRNKRNKGTSTNGGGGGGGGGSWLLRQSIGKGGSIGEKLGETVEDAAYKAVCTAIMGVLARSISALHGINVMTHSDIRLFIEHDPDLPPVRNNNIETEDYAKQAIEKVIQKGAKMRSKKKKKHHHTHRNEEDFIQRAAVVETLISHCQISAPLLKLFPLAWQRAILSNIISLIAAVVSDFARGIKIQILGHQLSISFLPITESDMIQHIGSGGYYSNNGFNHRRARPEEFEAAVRATAQDIAGSLQIFDRWHERAMGSGLVIAQMANLIARIVLTLVDEVLSGAQMDLWSAQAGGPRMIAGLEYRTKPSPEEINN
mmetsp:Transcript_15091/g.27359  ORF Transcript_15091/g.27359 Transcript_15091/m.27359 type:complete len:405 (-) Transcript_15091:67-1281(-)